jgi:hypothetical protein
MKVFDNMRTNAGLTWIAFDNNGAALGSLQALKNCVTNGNQTLLSTSPPTCLVSCSTRSHRSCSALLATQL